MQIKTVKTVQQYEISLNADEMQWLHAVTQNPLHGQTPWDETAEDREMRLAFFNLTDLRNH